MRDYMQSETGNCFTGRQQGCCFRHAGGRKRIHRLAGLLMLLAALCFVMNPRGRIYAEEKEFKECSVAQVRSAGQISETAAGYTENVTASYKDKGIRMHGYIFLETIPCICMTERERMWTYTATAP